MISQLENFSNKSFINFSTQLNFFQQKNIIFGYNGRGKSSFTEGIINYALTVDSRNNLRYFNKAYTKEQLLISDDNKKIKGIKASFGKKDVEIEKSINSLKAQLTDNTMLEKQCREKRIEIRNKIDNIHDIQKGKIKINKKKAGISLEDVFDQYKSDLKKALKIINTEKELKEFSLSTEEHIEKKNLILNLDLPDLNIEIIQKADQDFLFRALSTTYNVNEDVPSNEIIEWLEKGIPFHEDNVQKCKFCNGNIDITEIKKRIKKYKENILQSDIDKLNNISKSLKSNITKIENAKKQKDSLLLLGIQPSEVEEIFSFPELDKITILEKAVTNKVKDMSKKFSKSNIIPAFEKIIKSKKEIILMKRARVIDDLDTKISNIQDLAKGKIAIEIIDSQLLDQFHKIQIDENEIICSNNRNSQISEKIEELRKSQSPYNDFKEFMNETLQQLNLQFKLTIEENNYYLRHTLEEIELTTENISEGEKNLLALLFFYYELYQDNNQDKIKENIKLIVIDDPVSSLDAENKFYVLEIIKKILSEKKPQIFLLTHSWEDYCQITYSCKEDNPNIKFLEIYKDPNDSYHSKIREIKKSKKPYEKLFQEIFILSRKTDQEIDDCEIYHASNSMRRIFEEFLNFKSPGLIPQKKSQNHIEDIYYTATNKNMSKNLKLKTGSLLTSINVLSHNSMRTIEVLQNSKTLMTLIKDMDKAHYNAMIKEVLQKNSNK